MGKPEVKHTAQQRNILTLSRPITRSKTTPIISSANIRVVVRVRPPNQKESEENNKIVIKFVDEQMLVFDPKIDSHGFFYHGVEQKGRDLLRKANKDMQFMFDRVFGFDSTNLEVFENTTQTLIKSLMDGYNCSVFAYGATGAGKTHTMIGNTEAPGITYLTMAELFKAREELTEERNFELGITYIEVYNELVQDLLNPGVPLQLREDGKHSVKVAGIKVHKIRNPEELFALLTKGNANRTQHPTDANAESSRSHAVFQVYIEMEIKSTREVRAAKLSMIDLAGSERGSVTGFGGARFAEGANINKSLLALGNCINSLADGQKHVPYRDSKLTRLLKDSLGGNCQTIMIANISPSSASYEDSYNTLKYATRAKNIKSNIKKNVLKPDLHPGEYIRIVEDMKKEIDRMKKEIETEKQKKQQVQAESIEVRPVVDSSLLKKFMNLIEERKRLLERKHNVQTSGHMFQLRRRFKEDADNRLSGLTLTPDKAQAHARLGNVLDRLKRQEEAIKTELADICVAIGELEMKCNDLVKRHPELDQVSELEFIKLARIECEYEVELDERRYAFVEDELNSRGAFIANTCRLSRPVYMQLRGHGLAPDSLLQEFHTLVDQFEASANNPWLTEDSDLPSPTTSESEIVRAPKRRLKSDELDQTYVLEAANRARVARGAEELLTKVSTTPDGAKKKGLRPHKENKMGPPVYLAKKSPKVLRKVSSKPDLSKRRPFRT